MDLLAHQRQIQQVHQGALQRQDRSPTKLLRERVETSNRSLNGTGALSVADGCGVTRSVATLKRLTDRIALLMEKGVEQYEAALRESCPFVRGARFSGAEYAVRDPVLLGFPFALRGLGGRRA
ncbi:hypothetical protein ACIHAR_29480 [Streptomyces sp. NPDC052016]|uniref:hypothetical protein n=1 Tax=Streptomyces sp. NPDC052016 TaxID=3365680 RepID=UPI0037CD04D6